MDVQAAVARRAGRRAVRVVITERAVHKHVTAVFAMFGLPADAGDNRRILAVPAYLRPVPTRTA